MHTSKIKTKRNTITFDKPEPYIALDNMGRFYAILAPQEVAAAKKAGRTIVSFTPLTLRETKIAKNNLLNAALEALPGIPEQDPKSKSRGRSRG